MLLRALGLLVGVVVPLAALVAGLRSTDPFWLLRRPRLLARSLFAILVVVPVIDLVLAEVLSPRDVLVRAGLAVAVLSVGMEPLDLLKRTKAPKDIACYVIGLDVVLITVAAAYLPLAVAIHGAIFHHEISLPWANVGEIVLIQALLPLCAGVIIARRLPKIARVVDRWAPAIIGPVMLVVAVIAVLAIGPRLLALGANAWMTCLAIAAVALLVGHLLGGPTRGERAVLAGFSVVRFPALAVLLTARVPRGERLIPIVVAYVVSSAVVVGIYRAVVRRRQQRAQAPADTASLR